MVVRWTWSRFAELSLDDLYDALALRSRVFVLEQGPYQDPDGLDRHAWHLLGRDAAGALQAYLRVIDGGQRFAEPSIGRVVTSPEARGSGHGRRLVSEGLVRCAQVWPGQPVRISAQSHLQRFYGGFGFRTAGTEYLEDGIPHVEMLREG
ncbi:MAG: GNAT family N-acetyltransferase [Rubrivivax sp.]